MSQFRHEETRLTPEQRDRVLDLATRLQAEHDGTIAVGDLAQAAAEAGIDPRFVHAAARQVTHVEPSTARPVLPADRTAAGALLAALTLMNVLFALTPLGQIADSPGAIWGLLLAGVAGVFAVRGRLPVWLVSAVTVTALLVTATFESLTHQHHDLGRIAMMILLEAVVAFVAGLATAASAYFRHVRESSQSR